MGIGKQHRLTRGRIGALAVTSVTVVAAALVTLSTTAASAATATDASAGHVLAPQTASGCVTEYFSINDEGIHEECVFLEQLLLDNLYIADDRAAVPSYLAQDGYYGPATTSVVRSFQAAYLLQIDGITGPQTWAKLCEINQLYNFTGMYWKMAGCASE